MSMPDLDLSKSDREAQITITLAVPPHWYAVNRGLKGAWGQIRSGTDCTLNYRINETSITVLYSLPIFILSDFYVFVDNFSIFDTG